VRPILALAALAAAVVLLRRALTSGHSASKADEYVPVGMPTTITWPDAQAGTTTIDWNRFFTTGYVGDPDWRN
jgi:hypothetical protein